MESELEIVADVDQGREFWQPHVDAFNGMGITKLKYCQEYNVGYHRFLYWHRKLSKKSNNLLPVKLKSSGLMGSLCTLESPKGFRLNIHEEQVLTKVLSWLSN